MAHPGRRAPPRRTWRGGPLESRQELRGMPIRDRGGGVGSSRYGVSGMGSDARAPPAGAKAATRTRLGFGISPGSQVTPRAVRLSPHGTPSRAAWRSGARRESALQTGHDAWLPPLAHVHTCVVAGPRARTIPGRPIPAPSATSSAAIRSRRHGAGLRARIGESVRIVGPFPVRRKRVRPDISTTDRGTLHARPWRSQSPEPIWVAPITLKRGFVEPSRRLGKGPSGCVRAPPRAVAGVMA
jgi:hypothetical protein